MMWLIIYSVKINIWCDFLWFYFYLRLPDIREKLIPSFLYLSWQEFRKFAVNSVPDKSGKLFFVGKL